MGGSREPARTKIRPPVISQIKIIMKLNVPGSPEEGVVLSKDVLQAPPDAHVRGVQQKVQVDAGGYSKYPYFSYNRLYPMHKIAKYGFHMRVNFFFNKTEFSRTISNAGVGTLCTETDSELSAEHYSDIRIANCNIRFMIAMLFPTSAPSCVNNHRGSFEHFIKSSSLPWPSVQTVFNPEYSYILVGGKPQTVLKTIWLNDFVNHPVYKSLIDAYTAFDVWKQATATVLKGEEEAIENTIIRTTVQTNSANLEIEEMNRGLDKILASGSGTTSVLTQRVNIENQVKTIRSSVMDIFGRGPAPTPPGDAVGPTTQESAGKYRDSEGARQSIPLAAEAAYEMNGGRNRLAVRGGFRADPAQSAPAGADDGNIVGLATTKDREFSTKKANISGIVEKINDIENSIKLIGSALGPSYRIISGSMKDKIDILIKSVARRRLVKILNATYFNDAVVVDPNFTKDDNIRELVESSDEKYKTYAEFVKKINEFSSPTRKTLNAGLQTMISNFTGNLEPRDFGKYIRFVRDRFFAINTPGQTSNPNVRSVFPRERYAEYFGNDSAATPESHLFVGACVVEESKDVPIYEIYVRVDVVGGVLTKDNQGALDCTYKSESLGNDLLSQINMPIDANPGKLQEYTFYYDIDSSLVQSEPNGTQPASSSPNKGGGGKTNIYARASAYPRRFRKSGESSTRYKTRSRRKKYRRRTRKLR